MFTRVVEVNSKPGKSHELANTINEKVLPILRQQAGFIDETVLTSETEPNRVIALSFGKTKEAAERYKGDQSATTTEYLSPHLESAPAVRTFNVHTSTPHRIAAGK